MLKCIKDQRGGGGRVPGPWGRVEGFRRNSFDRESIKFLEFFMENSP